MEKKFYLKEEEKIDDGFNYSSVLFPYFPSRADIIEPLGTVSLEYFLNAHKNPKEKMLETFKQIEEATKNGDKKLKDKLKQTKLTYFTPSVCLTKRNYDSITSFTGVMVMEYDKLGEEDAQKLKKKIFKRFKSCICAYISPSGSGCKFLFKIPVVDTVAQYKEYFYGLASYLEKIDGFDTSNQSCVLPLFISYDLDMLIRPQEELETWILKGVYPNSTEGKEYSDVKADDVSEDDRRMIFNVINKRFREIDEDGCDGHNRVRNISHWCGGLVASGYVSEQEVIDYIHDKITNSTYCNGRKDYYRTSSHFVREGMAKPFLLNKD